MSIFADKPFGSAVLPRRHLIGYSLAPMVRNNSALGSFLYFALRVRSGKFLLDGTEVLF